MSALASNAETLGRELDDLVARLESGDVDTDGILEALVGLRSGVEELRIVEDELVRSAEELASAHAEIDFERRRYEDLFALAPDAHIVTDEKGAVVEANVAAEELLQIPRRFIQGKPLVTFVAFAARRDFRTMVANVARSSERIVSDYRFLRRGGVAFDARVTAAPLHDRERRVTGLRFVLRDVTEELQTEARLWELNSELELRVSERTDAMDAARAQLATERMQFDVVLTQLPAAVVVADDDGRIRMRNSQAEQMFGTDVGHVDELAAQLRAENDVRLRPGSLAPPHTGEERVLRYLRLGDVFLDATAAPVGLDGKTTGTAYVFRDVTDQRRRDVAQRQFVVNAAHELRTPLAAIVSAVDVLQGGAKDDEEARDRFLSHLEAQTRRLTALVRSLLLLARAQSGVETPRRDLIPVRPLLEEIAGVANVASAVDVVVDCDPTIATLANDELLTQALSNLVENAARFTNEGTILVRAVPSGDQSITIEVVDTGSGMTADELAHATDRFVSSGDGFGLGLSIAADAARAAGGELELESEPGRGTTGRLVVPLARLVGGGELERTRPRR